MDIAERLIRNGWEEHVGAVLSVDPATFAAKWRLNEGIKFCFAEWRLINVFEGVRDVRIRLEFAASASGGDDYVRAIIVLHGT